MNGKVWLVGAGPADYELLTIKAQRLLTQADVIVYDALVGPAILAALPTATRKISVGKRAGNHPIPQEEINQILLQEAQAGHKVLRLKGGDPFLFGRGGEELELLIQHNIPYEIVPGVTSAIAVPAYGGVPVTHRDAASSVHIITAHAKAGHSPQIAYNALAQLKGTLVFLMGVSAIPQIAAGLLAAGMSPTTPAAFLEKGTTAAQRQIFTTLGTMEQDAINGKLEAPAIVTVGQVCALGPHMHWADKRPLAGVRVILTRPKRRASTLHTQLLDLGAEVIPLPAIETQLLPANASLAAALQAISTYHWLVLTSPSGVEHLLEYLQAQRLDIRLLHGLKIAAIGAATAKALQSHGLVPELVPTTYSAAALGAALGQSANKGDNILILRAKEGSLQLTAALKTAGLAYTDVPLYQTMPQATPPAEKQAYLQGGGAMVYVALTAASTVHGFAQGMAANSLQGISALCIGPETAAAAAQYGMATYTAPEATIPSMVQTLQQIVAENKRGN